MLHCLTEKDFLDFLEAQENDPLTDQIILHLESCPSCKARLDAVALSTIPLVKRSSVLLDPLLPQSEHAHTIDGTPLPTLHNYVYVCKIGRGGMGDVFEYHDIRLNRRVAVKTLRTENIKPESLQRHRREALLQAGLNHPNIVPVYEFEISPTGLPYFVMELVQGRTLAGLIRDRTLTIQQSVRILMQVARAVAFAHEQKILHRDLTPSNILLTQPQSLQASGQTEPPPAHLIDWNVKLTDFGLSRMIGTESDITRSQTVMGTPAYLAPECVNGGISKAGAGSDIYAIGVVLYECLTGRPPFLSENIAETLRMIQETEPIPPRFLTPNLTKDLETICLKCLEKQPLRRYHSAAELADDLERFLAGQPIMARPLGRIGKIARWCGRNQRLAGALAIASLSWVCLGLGGYWFAYEQAELRRLADEQTAQARTAEQMAVDQSDYARNNFMASLYRSNELAKQLARLERMDQPKADITLLRQDLEKRIARTSEDFLNRAANQAELKGTELDRLFKDTIEIHHLGLTNLSIPVFERLVALSRTAKATSKDYHQRIQVGIKSATVLGMAYKTQQKPEKALAVMQEAWRREPDASATPLPNSPSFLTDRLILGIAYQAMLKEQAHNADADALEPLLNELKQAIQSAQATTHHSPQN